MTSPGYRLQLLEHSDLAQTLLLSMAALENQPKIKLKLLQTLQFLSSSSGQYLDFFLSQDMRWKRASVGHVNLPDWPPSLNKVASLKNINPLITNQEKKNSD